MVLRRVGQRTKSMPFSATNKPQRERIAIVHAQEHLILVFERPEHPEKPKGSKDREAEEDRLRAGVFARAESFVSGGRRELW
jgi:hypothetical protein